MKLRKRPKRKRKIEVDTHCEHTRHIYTIKQISPNFPSFISLYVRKDTHTHIRMRSIIIKYTSPFVPSSPFIAFSFPSASAYFLVVWNSSFYKGLVRKHTCHLSSDGCAISQLNSSDSIFIPLIIIRFSMALFLTLTNTHTLSRSRSRNVIIFHLHNALLRQYARRCVATRSLIRLFVDLQLALSDQPGVIHWTFRREYRRFTSHHVVVRQEQIVFDRFRDTPMAYY